MSLDTDGRSPLSRSEGSESGVRREGSRTVEPPPDVIAGGAAPESTFTGLLVRGRRRDYQTRRLPVLSLP
jgi:hypothetical protein